MSEATTPKKRGTLKYVIIAIVAIIAIIVIRNSFFILYEGESALLQRFGRIEAVFMREASDEVAEQIASRGVTLRTGTGLRMRIPFIDNIIRYPSKLILYDSPPTEVLTRDRHRLYFDNTAHWRIENPLLFFQALADIPSARTRIDDVLFAEMRIRVGQIESYELISNREESGRMMAAMVEAVNHGFSQRGDGISIVDIRIRRTDLPTETYDSIYNRMNTERQRVAAEHRAEGDEILYTITSETDREVAEITSRAYREAEEIRGRADSEAARIYNEAYSQDPRFFEFYNLMETYRQTVAGSTIVIPLDSPFAKYLLGVTSDSGGVAAAPPLTLEE